MALKVRVTEDRSFSRTVHLDGRLDNDTAAILDGELEKLADAPVNIVVFDLSDLHYISSAGLRSLFRAQKTMSERAGRIVLANPQPQIQKVFEIVKAADIAAVFTSTEELDRYLDTMQRKVLENP
jgi:anti-anti-sigma factor